MYIYVCRQALNYAEHISRNNRLGSVRLIKTSHANRCIGRSYIDVHRIQCAFTKHKQSLSLPTIRTDGVCGLVWSHVMFAQIVSVTWGNIGDSVREQNILDANP